MVMSKTHVSAAMMMTAGMGTRLSPFTRVQTKALMPVLGIPAAQYSVDTLVAAGVKRVVANLHHLASSTRSQLLNLDYSGAELVLSDESQQILGTAGGIKRALPLLGKGPILRANADVICDIRWQELIDRHEFLRRKRGVALTMVLLKHSGVGEAYSEVLTDSTLECVSGLGKLTTEGYFWSGAAILEQEALAHVPEIGPSEFVPTILHPALRDQKVGVFMSESPWFDIGSPSLWLDTHLNLLSLLEEKNQALTLFPRWRERILDLNYRISSGVWIRKGVELNRDLILRGPLYIGFEGEQEDQFEELGPRCVVYDAKISQRRLSQGIGYCGFWVGEN